MMTSFLGLMLDICIMQPGRVVVVAVIMVCSMLSALCCLLSAVCCLLSAVCCLLPFVCIMQPGRVVVIAFIVVIYPHTHAIS
jgi:hypothetical protein